LSDLPWTCGYYMLLSDFNSEFSFFPSLYHHP
jgi:hypothetical protein